LPIARRIERVGEAASVVADLVGAETEEVATDRERVGSSVISSGAVASRLRAKIGYCFPSSVRE
jgi:hypothetical protein